MRNISVLFFIALVVTSAAQGKKQPTLFGAGETGIANQLLRYPSSSPAGTRPTFGSMNLASSAAVGSSILGVANGGTGLASGTSGGIPYYSGTGTLASSALLTASQLMIGGGAGTTPSVLAAGTQYQPLVMGASAPGYAALNLAQSAATTGQLPVAKGGTGAATLTGAMVGNGTGAVTAGTLSVANGGTGQTAFGTVGVLHSDGSALSSSKIVAADITSATITGTQIASDVQLPGATVRAGGNNIVVSGNTGANDTMTISGGGLTGGCGSFSSNDGATCGGSGTGYQTVAFNVTLGGSVSCTCTPASGGSATFCTIGGTSGTGSTFYTWSTVPALSAQSYFFACTGLRP